MAEIMLINNGSLDPISSQISEHIYVIVHLWRMMRNHRDINKYQVRPLNLKSEGY